MTSDYLDHEKAQLFIFIYVRWLFEYEFFQIYLYSGIHICAYVYVETFWNHRNSCLHLHLHYASEKLSHPYTYIYKYLNFQTFVFWKFCNCSLFMHALALLLKVISAYLLKCLARKSNVDFDTVKIS